MVTADDTVAALRTEVAEPVDIPMKTFTQDELVVHIQRPTSRRGAA